MGMTKLCGWSFFETLANRVRLIPAQGMPPCSAREPATIVHEFLRPENSRHAHSCKGRSEEHTSELQSHSFISYAVFCLKKKSNEYTSCNALRSCPGNNSSRPHHG